MANVFYVEASGNDSNDGSAAHPFASLSHAVSVANSHGTTINLVGEVSIMALSINKGITLQGVDETSALSCTAGTMTIIAGSGVTSTDSVTFASLSIYGCEITASGVGVTMTDTSLLTYGMSSTVRFTTLTVDHAARVTLVRVTISDTQGEDVTVPLVRTLATVDSILVLDSDINCVAGTPAVMWLSGGNVTIRDTSFKSLQGSGRALKIDGVPTATLERLTFDYITVNNDDDGGGAVWLRAVGLATIRQSTFTCISLQAGIIGGALLVDVGSAAVLSDNVWSQNTVGSGGAMAVLLGASVTINRDNFTQNSAFNRGGAIACMGGAVSIVGGYFAENRAGEPTEAASASPGGAIYLSLNSTLDVSWTTFVWTPHGQRYVYGYPSTSSYSTSTVEVAAATLGGGIYAMDTSIVSLRNTHMSGFYATDMGGAIFAAQSIGVQSGGMLLIANSTFSGNSACRSGGAIYALPRDFTMENVVFEGNGAETGGALLAGPRSESFWCNVSFIGNLALNNGEALALGGGAVVLHSPTAFCVTVKWTTGYAVNNRATVGGGAIWNDGQQITIVGVMFLNNTAGGQAGAIQVQFDAGLETYACVFQGNSANIGGAVNVIAATAFIDYTIFLDNSASTGGAVNFDTGATALIGDCSLIGNSAALNGGALAATTIYLTFRDTPCLNNTAGLNGGCLYVSTATAGVIAVTDFTIHGNSAAAGGGAYITGTVTMSDCDWSHNNADSGGAIATTHATLKLVRNHFTDNVASSEAFGIGGGIYATSATVNIDSSSFVLNRAVAAGGALFWDSGDFVVTRTTFDGNTALTSGGAVAYAPSIAARAIAGPHAWLSTCLVTNNVAHTLGGGLFVPSEDVILTNVNVSHNSAGQDGGGIYLSVLGLAADRLSQVINNSIAANLAQRGGNVFLSSGGAGVADLAQTLDAVNVLSGGQVTAEGYGPNMATPPASLAWSLDSNSPAVYQSGDTLGNTSVPLAVRVYDALGNAVTTPRLTINLAVSPAATSRIVPTQSTTDANGVASFASTTLLTSIVGVSLLTATATATTGADNSLVTLTSANLSISIGACRLGYALLNPNADFSVCARVPCPAGTAGTDECVPCEAGYYAAFAGQATCQKCSIDAYSMRGAIACITCPAGAQCGSGVPQALPGFWHSPTTGAFIACPGAASACLGAVDGCPVGYANDSYACSVCQDVGDAHYARLSPGVCAECLPSGATVVVFIVLVIFVAGLFANMVATASDVSGDSSAVSKILINYLQVSALGAAFQSTAKTTLAKYLAISSSGAASFNAFPTACLFNMSVTDTFIATVALPFVMIPIILLGAWMFGIICHVRADKDGRQALRKRVTDLTIVSFIVMLFSLYPNLSTECLRMFQCRAEDNRLAADVNITCYSPQHMPYVILAGIGIAIYTVGIPLAFLTILYRIRGRTTDPHVMTRYSVLYKRYRSGTYIWELFILLRKTVLVFILVFATNPIIQTSIGAIFVMANFGIHVYAKPYESRMLNHLEAWSLATVTFTIVAGVMYSATSPDGTIVLTTILIIVNAVLTVALVTIFLVLRVRKLWAKCRGKDIVSESISSVLSVLTKSSSSTTSHSTSKSSDEAISA